MVLERQGTMTISAVDNLNAQNLFQRLREEQPANLFGAPLSGLLPFAPALPEGDLLTKGGKLSPALKRDVERFLAKNPSHPLSAMKGHELTQLLVDYLENGMHQQQHNAPPRYAGSLSGPTYTNPATPTSWSPTAGATSGGAAGPTAPTNGSTKPLGAKGLAGMKHASAEQVAKLIPEAGKPFVPQIMAAAKKYDVPPLLIASVIQQESNFDPNAGSGAGARGLMQLMPETGRSLGVSNPLDPAQSIDGGTKYLRQQLDEFGSLPKALAAYNAGPGAVQQHGGVPPYAETQDYVKKIPAQFEAWRKELPASYRSSGGDPKTVRGAAQAILDSGNVTFWDGLSTGSDRKALEQIARTGRSDVPFAGGNTEPNPKMMQALAEMAKKGPIQITALTGGEHSVGSNHYDGNAVDLSIHTGDASQIEAIANKYGGTRNHETDHIHLDFLS